MPSLITSALGGSYKVGFPIGGALSLGIMAAAARVKPREKPSDQPLLNKKVAQMVGRTFVLEQPIVNGHGKVRVNDALWSIAGDDLPAGARVTVVATEGITLRVQPAP